jgi:hypothetical protein
MELLLLDPWFGQELSTFSAVVDTLKFMLETVINMKIKPFSQSSLQSLMLTQKNTVSNQNPHHWKVQEQSQTKLQVVVEAQKARMKMNEFGCGLAN